MGIGESRVVVNIILGQDDMTSWGLMIIPPGGEGYANERPWIDGHRGIKGGGEHNSRVG